MALDANGIPELHQIPPDNGQIQKEANTLIEALGETTTTQTEVLKDIDKTLKETSQKSEEKGSQEQKKSFEFFEKMNSKFNEIGTNIIENNKEILVTGLLGPMSLITKPFEEFAGVSIADSIANVFKPKRSKVSPSINDVAKEGETGILFLWSKLKTLLGREDEEGSLLDKLNNMGGIGPLVNTLLKAGAIAAIVGGLIWAVVDGLKGSMLAGEWGVSNISGFIGGFFGGTESGFKGAFKNMGKWALIGAGIGFLAGGPIGAIAGGLLGAGIGAVLGYIGGEQIAQNVEKMKTGLSEIWQDGSSSLIEKLLGSGAVIMEFFSNGLVNFFGTAVEMIAGIFVKDEDQRKKIGQIAKDIFETAFSIASVGLLISGVISGGAIPLLIFSFKNIFSRMKESIAKFRESKGESSLLKRLLVLGGDLFIDFFQGLWDTLSKPKLMRKLGKWIVDKAWPKVKFWFMEVFENIGRFFGDIGDMGKEFATNVFTGITNWFLGILNIDRDEMEEKGFWRTLWDNTKDNIQAKIIDPLSTFFEGIGNIFGTLIDIMSQEDVRLDQKLLDLATFGSGGLVGSENSRERVNAIIEARATDTTVNDAIIKADGTIIQTSPDDNIIATKNNPAMASDDRVFYMMLEVLNKLLAETKAIKDKPVGGGGSSVSMATLENLSIGEV
jgi:hypothetical protein